MAFRENIAELVERESKNGSTQIDPSWSRVPLKSVAKVTNGYAFKSKQFNVSNGAPLIRIRDVLKGYTQTFYEGEIPDGYWVEKDDILVGMDGDFNTCRWPSDKALLNQRVCKIAVLDSGVYDSRFLSYLLPAYLKLINEHTSATTVKHLSSKTLSDLPIPNPSIGEQKRIADKLDSVLAKVEAAQARLDKIPTILKRFRQSVLAAATSGELTKDWRLIKSAEWLVDEYSVAEIASDEKYSLAIGPFGSNLKVVDYRDSGHPLVFVRDIRSKEFGVNLTKYVDDDKFEQLLAHRVQPGDILITKMGDPPGDVAIYPTNRPKGVITSDCIKVTPNDDLVYREYLALFFESHYFQQQIKSITAGVAQQKVSLKKFKLLKVELPELSEQHAIIMKVNELFEHSYTIEKQYNAAKARLDKLTQSILAKAFRGELITS